jgi:D-sedoheptulose 7-phosphate isomerase
MTKDSGAETEATLVEPMRVAAEIFTKTAADAELHAVLRIIVTITAEVLRSGGTLFTYGNGGSAAQAAHVAGELVGPFYNRHRRPLRAIPLGFDPSSLTAISTSGNSRNVLAALEKAKALAIYTVLFSNHDGGKARRLADQFLYTPPALTPRVQELHLLYAHALCEAIERQLA